MSLYSLLERPRIEIDGNFGKVRNRVKKGKKKKVERTLKRKLAKVAQQKFNEAQKRVTIAKAHGQKEVKILIALPQCRTVSAWDTAVIESITHLIWMKYEWKVRHEIREVFHSTESEEGDDESESCGGIYATFLVISGFAKPKRQ